MTFAPNRLSNEPLTIVVRADQNRVPYFTYGAGGMKILARRIRRELRVQTGRHGHCAIYEEQLQRVWPINEVNRKTKIEQFAKEHGFRLAYYKSGLCAIFEAAQLKE